MKNKFVIPGELSFKEKPKIWNFKDLEGEKIGRLVAIGYLGRTLSARSMWLFRCDCGNFVKFSSKDVLSRGVASCGNCR